MTDYDTLAQLLYNGAFQQIPSLVNAAKGVHLERGVTDDQDIKQGVCTWQINDDADRYRPSNAASDIYGQTGPYMRAAFATSLSVRFSGEITSMQPGQTKDHRAVAGTTVRGRRWVDVKVAGPLGRVGAWRDPLSSPLSNAVTGLYGPNLRGYFPLEDGQGASQLANVAYPLRPGQFSGGVAVGRDQGPHGAATCLTMASAGSVTLPYASMSTTAGFQLAFAHFITTADATPRPVCTWRMTNGFIWTFTVDTTNYGITVFDPVAGTNVVAIATAHGSTGAGPGQWVFHRIKVQVVAGNVQIEPSFYAEAASTFWGVTTNYAGTNMGAPVQATLQGNATTASSLFSHHFVVTGVTDNLEAGAFTDAFRGYSTERAADRFTRLCAARNLPYLLRGTASKTARMGVQPLVTQLDQYKQIRTTEGGLIFDRGDTIGIVFATRDYLYGQAASPVLDITTAQLQEDPAETDAEIFNVVTADSDNGGSATVALTTGRYGTALPPTGAGRLDKQVKVNTASDAQLLDIATWWLRYYTQPGARFEQLVIDLDAQPGLTAACNAAEPGMFARLTGRTPDPLLLLILSTAQDTNRKRNVFTFTVAPGDIYNVGVYDAATSRYDSGTTTLAEDLTTIETGADVRTTNYHDRWSTTAVPYDVMIAGERSTCTAVTAATFSGGYWNQTMTLTRSVNGVVKNQTTGAQVQLADPRYYG